MTALASAVEEKRLCRCVLPRATGVGGVGFEGRAGVGRRGGGKPCEVIK